jgi:hypothetical protein
MVRLQSRHVAVVIVLVFVIGIGSSIALGYWNTESRRVTMRPSSDRSTGQYERAESGSDEAHDENTVFVRGTTTIGDLYDWGLSREQIEQALGFAVGVRAQKVRDAGVGAGVRFSEAKVRLQNLLESLVSDVRE